MAGNFGQMNFAFWKKPPIVNPTVTYLVVAGGGGGGGNNGGGGAGGFLTGSVTLTSGVNYTITVGAGGAGSSSNDVTASNGSDSIISG